MTAPNETPRLKLGFWTRFAIFLVVGAVGTAGSLFSKASQLPMGGRIIVVVIGSVSIALVLTFLMPLLDRRGRERPKK
jgi:hypothetical protein